MKVLLFTILSILTRAWMVTGCAMANDDPPAELTALVKSDEGPSLQERNKQVVLNFYKELFGDKHPESMDKYIDAEPGDYIQHNTWLPDGREALKNAAREWFKVGPWNAEVLRSAAEGDLVFLHVKASSAFLKKALGADVVAIVDIFRVANEKIVEHWDAIQPVPEKSANSHPMF